MGGGEQQIHIVEVQEVDRILNELDGNSTLEVGSRESSAEEKVDKDLPKASSKIVEKCPQDLLDSTK